MYLNNCKKIETKIFNYIILNIIIIITMAAKRINMPTDTVQPQLQPRRTHLPSIEDLLAVDIPIVLRESTPLERTAVMRRISYTLSQIPQRWDYNPNFDNPSGECLQYIRNASEEDQTNMHLIMTHRDIVPYPLDFNSPTFPTQIDELLRKLDRNMFIKTMIPNANFIQDIEFSNFHAFIEVPNNILNLRKIAYYKTTPLHFDGLSDNLQQDILKYLHIIIQQNLVEGIEGGMDLLDKTWFTQSPRLQLKIQYLKDNNYLHRIYMSNIDCGFEEHIDKRIVEMEALV